MNMPTSVRSLANATQQRWQAIRRSIVMSFAAWRGQSQEASDPSARLFRGIQQKLILWYGGVLAVILIVASVVLYLGMQQELLSPVYTSLTSNAMTLSQEWQDDGVPPCIDNPKGVAHAVQYVACYTPDGNQSVAVGIATISPGFLNASLVKSALANSTNQDSVDADNGQGMVSRYALVVRDRNDQHILGVILVGDNIGDRLAALATLRTLLIFVGLLTLLGSSIGGLILAQRALEPARLAHSRQQAFIADASHELRTPLTLLRTEAEVLLRGRERLAPADTELVEDIVAESAYLATLTNNLLTLARLDSGTTRIKHDVVDLTEIVTTIIHRTATLANEKHVIVRLAGKSAPLLILGDQQMLEQAVLILIDNAIKYNVANGEVTVSAARQGQHAVITVHDTGIGIDPEHLAHLGERFYRPDQARARETGGTGLGLSIAYGIAQAHRGTLTLTSLPEHGTTATLTLPAATLSDG